MTVEPDKSVKIDCCSIKDDVPPLDIGSLVTSMTMNKLFTFIRPGRPVGSLNQPL